MECLKHLQNHVGAAVECTKAKARSKIEKRSLTAQRDDNKVTIETNRKGTVVEVMSEETAWD